MRTEKEVEWGREREREKKCDMRYDENAYTLIMLVSATELSITYGSGVLGVQWDCCIFQNFQFC